jgi:hypothetical protein
MDLHVFDGAAPIVEFAFWLGVAVAAMTVVMLTATLLMRRFALRRERIYVAAVALWKPILVAEPGAAPAATPSLTDSDLPGFVRVWNDVHESLRGGTTDHLAKIAREVRLDEHLYRALRAVSFHDRVMAIIALGHVRSAESFSHVTPYLDDRARSCRCAARALLQVDCARRPAARAEKCGAELLFSRRHLCHVPGKRWRHRVLAIYRFHGEGQGRSGLSADPSPGRREP